MAVITGTQGNDGLWGTSGADTIDGLGGDDFIFGDAGNDSLIGGDGSDQFLMTLGPDYGSDTIAGGAGMDMISMGDARSAVQADLGAGTMSGGGGSATFSSIEMFVGGVFADRISGSSAADWLHGRDGNDTISGGAGDDTIYGSTGNDEIAGGDGADYLDGDVGDDTIDGQGGNDTIYGAGGNDSLLGGDGSDQFLMTFGADYGNDTIVGGAGMDMISLGDAQSGVQADLGAGTMAGGAAGGSGSATFSSIEMFVGGIFADRISGSSAADYLHGRDGNDTISGGAGADTLYGAAGNDELSGGEGADLLDGGDGDDTYFADAQQDVLADSSGIDTVVLTDPDAYYTLQSGFEHLTLKGQVVSWYEAFGNELDNRIVNELADNGTGIVLTGGAGNDTLIGSEAWEWFRYSAGDGHDVIDGGTGRNRIAADGTIDFGADLTISNVHEIWGGGGNDHFTLNDDGIWVSGSWGDDTLVGGAGNDTLVGDAVFDQPSEPNGKDSLSGGLGNDQLWGERGNDRLDGGAGNDTLNGGIGGFPGDDTDADTFLFTVAPGAADADQIDFFRTGEDQIRLDALVMPALGTSGTFAAGDARFYAAAGATGGHDADDRVVYNTSNGQLFYDADGSGGGAAQLIATLSGAPTLVATDIAVSNGTATGEAITGTAGNDTLNGTSGNDTIDGLNGVDTIDGAAGNDTLTGGGGWGSDVFRFSVSPGTANADHITDFESFFDDLILLDASAHPGIGALGNFSANDERFFAGAGANSGQDPTDRVVFNTTTAQLWYDADGSGSGAAQLIATLDGASGLRASEIWVTDGGGLNRVGTTGNDTLSGTPLDDTLDGAGGHDDLHGDFGRDRLIGGAGNDTLSAGFGSMQDGPTGDGSPDTLDGGLGDDTYLVGEAGDVIVDAGGVDLVSAWNTGYTLGPGVENLVIQQSWQVGTGPGIGNELDNHLRIDGAQGGELFGMGGNDYIVVGFLNSQWGFFRGDGGEGNDTLEAQNDTASLTGGSGADSFLLGRIADITDFASGTDKIRLDANAMPTLGTDGNFAPNDPRFYAAAGATGGHDADDRVIYNTTTRELFYDADGSGSGSAMLIAALQAGATAAATDIAVDNGTSGSTMTGTAGNDSLTGGAGNDTLNGLAGTDTLRGLDGDDVLDGGDGIDTLDGGLGNDTYIVTAGDVLVVDPGGIDTLVTAVSWDISPTSIDNITLVGTAGINASGNALANVLIGNDAANTFNGRAGSDTIHGNGGNDYFLMSMGGTSSFGNDSIDGGAGIDTVDFGANAQSALVADLAAGTVSGGEAGGAGFSTILNMEKFIAGNFADRVSGNAAGNNFWGGLGNDTLIGLAGGDSLSGADGNDRLEGGTGFDTLAGGAGADSFVFNSTAGSANADRINDFALGTDQLLFENDVLTALGAPGDWAAGDGRFRAAAGATSGADANDRLIYNTSNGNLYYDPDGLGGTAGQILVTLSGAPALTAADITVI